MVVENESKWNKKQREISSKLPMYITKYSKTVKKILKFQHKIMTC